MAKYTPEEQARIAEILSPLNKNPVFTESLNPMAKVLRRIKGEPDPIIPDEEEIQTSPEETGVEEGGINFTTEEDFSESPPPLRTFDEDDSDIDALLNENIDSYSASHAKSEQTSEDFTEPPPEEISVDLEEAPTIKEFDFEEQLEAEPPSEEVFEEVSSPELEENPFDALGETEQFQEESFEESIPTQEESLEESTLIQEESFEDSFPTQEESLEESTLIQEESFEDSFPTQEESFEESIPTQEESFEESIPTQEESLDEFSSFEEKEPSPSEIPDFDLEEESTSELAPVEIEEHDPFSDFDAGGKEDFSPLDSTEDTEEATPLGELDEEEVHADYEQSLEEDISSLAEDTLEPEPELTDEELALIQRELLRYPPKLKRAVIDAITKDKISPREKRELLELIKAEQKPEDIATYLSEKLGYEVELVDSSGEYSEAGIPIIATKPIYTKKGEFERRQKLKRTILLSAAGILLLIGLITGYKYVYIPFRAASYYEDGLEQIKKAGSIRSGTARKEHLENAEKFFKQGEKINPGDLEYLNKYGMAYMKIGEYERAFEKLFGKVEPDFGKGEKDAKAKVSWAERKEIPYIELESGQKWDEKKLELADYHVPSDPREVLKLRAQDKTPRRIIKAGAYIFARLGKKIHDNQTYINLGRFHSNNAVAFKKGTDGQIYKNDDLAISYFKHVFMDGGEPDNVEARAGLAKIYYNQENFGKAVSQYNQIIEKYPKNTIGHGGLLSTYIEMWKRDRNPQYVLNHHRRVRNELDIEDELSLYTLSKLAAFYIELDPTELRIRYNVDPEDQVTNMDIGDNIIHLLNIAFSKSEKQDGVKVSGDEYAEQYYQRGRYYISKNESLRALQQFELAATYDPAHYLAVMEMAEHYMRLDNNEEARKLLLNAANRYKAFSDFYGNKEEDETLIQGDIGRVFFNLGKVEYLESALPSRTDKIDEFPARKVYPFHGTRSIEMTEQEKERRDMLQNALKYFDLAEKYQLQDPIKRREMFYYLGWINYMSGDFETALAEFSKLSEEDGYNNPNVMMGKANSYYYSGQINAALGNYLKIIEDFEEKAALIANPVPDESTHQEIYQTLIAAYNNVGAVYERKNNTSQALKYYWKSIETARRINSTTEIANFNKDMVFKNKKSNIPLLDDWLSPTIDSIKELRNSKKKNNFF